MARVVVLTGVSSGIGLEQARSFLENGDKVYGIDKEKAPQLAGDFSFLQADLAQDWQKVQEWLPDKIDILCNTAGILDAYQTLLEVSEEEFDRIFQVNFFAAVKLTRHVLPLMLQEKQGIVINMCSIASFLAGGGGVAYTSSKHALAGFTKQLALDLADKGIQVFGLAPGAVKTAMTASDFEEGGLSDWVADETPIKRWLEPSEIADVTLFLASGKASAMQGEIVKIDGGWSLK